jgi:tetratricopeptide (TPR) repeat protein
MQNSPAKQQALRCFQKRQYKKARNLYEKALTQNRNDAEVLYMLGSIHGQTGRPDRAVDYFEQTIKLQPDAVVAYCALGAVLKQLKRYPQAEQAFRKAIGLKPDYQDAELELAGILLHQNKLGEAKELLQKIASQNPLCAEAFHGLGEIAHAQQSLDDAIRYYEKALELKPDRAITHNRIGTAQHHKGLLEEAITHFEAAVAVQPDFPEAFRNMGNALLAAGKLDEATACFDKAVRLRPSYVDAISGKASTLERQGDHLAAYKVIEPLIEKHIEHPGLGIVFSEICIKLDRSDEAVNYLERLLAKAAIPDNTREQMHYALGKTLDKLEDYDKAFEHFRKANNLRPVSSLPVENSATVDAIINAFNWGFLASAPRSSNDSDRPIFIVGMPRSGTSLTEQVLASHPGIDGAGELAAIGNYVAEIAGKLGGKRGFPYCLTSVSKGQLDSYAVRYLDHLKEISASADFVTDKMPQNFIHLGLIALMFPKARIIHCRRDPIDTCLSIYFQHFNEAHEYASRLEHIAYYYLDYRRLMDHWKTVLDLPILDVQYQDMVTDLESVAREMLDFIGIEWSENCLRFHESERFVSTSSYEQVRQPIYTSSICRWKNYEKHIGPLKDILAPLYQS